MINLETASSYQLLNFIVFVVFIVSAYLNRKAVLRFSHKVKATLAEKSPEQKVPGSTSGCEISEIVLICYKDGCTIAYNHFNQPVPWVYNSMKASMDALPAEHYFRIRREIILRADWIDRVVKESKAFSVQLKPPFSDKYVVAKKNLARFRAFGEKNRMPWWNRMRNRFS